ncbi:MAG: hypothetical protein KKA64_04595 [Nanoarchaeota archaeon]|nr:hypothetical protein [Nanoarchaeota archaeon]
MGFIRGSAVFFLAVLTLSSLLGLALFFTLSSSLEYNNVKQGLYPVVEKIADEEMNLTSVLNSHYYSMDLHCRNNSEYLLSQEGFSFTIPCSIVSQGQDAIIYYGINETIKQVYYQKYDCSFLECFNKQEESKKPFFIVSEMSWKYFRGKFYSLLIISLVLIALLFLCIQNKKNLPILLGGLMMLSSLPFFQLGAFMSLFAEMDNSTLVFLSALLSNSNSVFWIMFVSGLILIGFGIATYFWSFAETIYEKIRGIGRKSDKDADKIKN